ncbi:MAG TPA: hypothetical protein VFA21_17810 [Pyrinomonadaceae bacterium]|nr:hypothetical protein [Pyrinomonadaceae bacterium]
MPHGTSRTFVSNNPDPVQNNFRLLTFALARANPLLASVFALVLVAVVLSTPARAQKHRHRTPAGGRAAIVVDERLAALRDAPELSANLLQRLSRGRFVSVAGERSSPDGVKFYRVSVTRRTSGWIQSDAVVRPSRAGDDERLLRLIRGSDEFDRIARARIFLDAFPRSTLRPAVLLIFGDTAEEAATKLTREAQRRLDAHEMDASGAPVQSYFLNFNGLDRYNRNGIKFVFDPARKQLHYDGAAWREILRRFPKSQEAAEARVRLEPKAAPPK